MVSSCSAYGCTSRFKKGANLGFFRFPKLQSRRKLWVKAVKRKNWIPSTTSLICGKHFQTGRPSKDVNHPDYVPNCFIYAKPKDFAKKYEERKAHREEYARSSAATVSAQNPIPMSTDSNEVLETLMDANNSVNLNDRSKTQESARLKNTALPSLYHPVPYANMPEKVGGQQIVAQKDPGRSINNESCKKQNPNIIKEIRSDKRDGAKALLLLSFGGPFTGVSNQRWLLLNTVNRSIGPTSSAKIIENESEPISTNSETTKNPSRVSDNVTSSVIENDEECYEMTSDVEEENALSIFRDEEANSEVSTNSEEILFQENETEEDSKEILKEKLKNLTVCYENSQRKLKEYQRICKLYVKEVTALREVINNLKQINSVADNYFEAKS